MTDDEANEMLAKLSKHFGCPVMPIPRYCEALRTWQKALHERALRKRAELFPGTDSTESPEREKAWENYCAAKQEWDKYNAPPVIAGHTRYEAMAKEGQEKRFYELQELFNSEDHANSVNLLFLQIQKSNLLARLLYGGEKLRAIPCPKHKGTWSGIEWSGNQCPHKCQLTGWIQEPVDEGKALPPLGPQPSFIENDESSGTVMVHGPTGEVLGKVKLSP
jgi:hypothetical protein